MTWFTRSPKAVLFTEGQLNFLIDRVAHEVSCIETRMVESFQKEFRQLKASLAQYISEVLKLKRELTFTHEQLTTQKLEYQSLLKQHLELALRFAPAQVAPANMQYPGKKPEQIRDEEASIRSYMSLFDDLPPGHEEGYTDDELMLVKEPDTTNGAIQEKAQ